MKRTFLVLVIASLVAAVVSGCSPYSQILKSKDTDLKYRMALKYYDAKKYSKTIQLLEEISHLYAGTPKEDSIAYYTGLAYYKQGDFQTSGMLFDQFRKTYGRSPFLEDAEYMYAKGYYFASPQPNKDQTATMQALMAIDEYLERYPNSPKKEAMEENMQELTQKLHDKAYINAKSYFTTGRYKSAVMSLKNALNQYPNSVHREELMYLLVKSNYLLAHNSITELQRDRYLDMMDSYYSFVSEYKDSKYLKELEKMQESAKEFLAGFGDGDGESNEAK